MNPLHPLRGLLGVVLAAVVAAGCGPRTEPAVPEPVEPDDAVPGDPDVRAECDRLFDQALRERQARAESGLDPVAIRSAVAGEAFLGVTGDPEVSAAADGLLRTILSHPAVAAALSDAVRSAASDRGAQFAFLAGLLDGGMAGIEARIEAASDRAFAAISAVEGRDGRVRAWLALPAVGALWLRLLPDAPFEAALADARSAVAASRAVADLRTLLVVPGDPDATRRALAEWVDRAPRIGCSPVARSAGLPAAVAGVPAVARLAPDVAVRLLHANVVRGEAVALARDLLADANFRLALDDLLVRAIRGDDDAALERAAAALLAVPALPAAVGAAAGRLAERVGELPDLTPTLEAVSADGDFRAVLARFLELLATTEGCLEP
jgi:hypothetical protein